MLGMGHDRTPLHDLKIQDADASERAYRLARIRGKRVMLAIGFCIVTFWLVAIYVVAHFIVKWW